MISRLNLWIGCGILLAASVGASSACAQNGIAFGMPGGYGIGSYNYGAGDINQPHIPYYALFPPVYYSHPVPRTYGYSPFAYPPGVMTPDVGPAVGAVEYLNPYVPQPTGPKPTSDKTAAKTYYNPFVQQASAASTLPIVERPAR
jgi:hypothetical protein